MTKTVKYTDWFKDVFGDSSIIEAAWYDSLHGQVYIKLRTTGQIVGYRDVSTATWDAFRNADSLGKYYNAYIKFRHQGVSGDVELVDAKVQADIQTVRAQTKFTVLASVSGEVKFETTGRDMNDAMVNFHNLVRERLEGHGVEVKIEGVTQHFN
jgi:hypothetical protein